MKVARGNAPSEYPPSDSESRSDALAGVRFFGKLGLVGKLPRSVLGICTARRAPPKAAARVLRKPTASRPSRWIVRKLCEAQERGRISAARAGQRQIFAKSWTSLARWPARAGWMVPDFRWIGRSETQRARHARLNDYTAKVWTSLADRRAGRGKRRSRVRKGEAEPKTPRRAGWGKRLIWTNLGRFSHDSPIPRGAESDFFSLCRWLRRGETPNGNEPTTFHSRHRPPGAYARGLRPVVISFSSLGALAGRALQLLNNHKTPAKLL